MLSLELITAIALWCGQPAAVRMFSGTTVNARDPKEVQECRERMFACVSKTLIDTTPCFKNGKYK